MSDKPNPSPPRKRGSSTWSLELLLVIGLPALTIVAGLYAMTLAYTHGFTPVPQAPPPAVHAS